MDAAGLKLLVLGRPELDGRPLRSSAEQLVLSWAALHSGGAVDLDRAGPAFWPELGAPAAGRKARDAGRSLSGHFPGSVSVVRGRLELAAGPEQIDEHRFGVLVSMPADGGDAERARLDAALALWRGTPYPGLHHLPVVRRRVAALQEMRLSTTERRFALGLAHTAGPPDVALVAELRAAVCAHPHRERLWRLLAGALFRSSRQSEALTEIDSCRRGQRERREQHSDALDVLHGAVLRGDDAAVRSAM